jgi:hypothetical protein
MGTLLSEANVAQELTTKSELSACCIVISDAIMLWSKPGLLTLVRVPDNRDANPNFAIAPLSLSISPHFLLRLMAGLD